MIESFLCHALAFLRDHSHALAQSCFVLGILLLAPAIGKGVAVVIR